MYRVFFAMYYFLTVTAVGKGYVTFSALIGQLFRIQINDASEDNTKQERHENALRFTESRTHYNTILVPPAVGRQTTNQVRPFTISIKYHNPSTKSGEEIVAKCMLIAIVCALFIESLI